MRFRAITEAIGQTMIKSVVIKIGGSLLSVPNAVSALLDAIVEASPGRQIVLAFGSGRLCAAMRDHVQPSFVPGPQASFEGALSARDFIASCVVSARTDLRLFDGLRQIPTIIAAGQLPVLQQSTFVRTVWPTTASRELSTDSVSALLAGLLGMERLILLKSVAGIFSSFPPPDGAPPLAKLSTAELRASRFNCVDGLLPTMLERFGLPCLVTNGLEPANVERWLATDGHTGTLVLPSGNITSEQYGRQTLL
jgi:aspartokinase-like uncharacterized kinase